MTIKAVESPLSEGANPPPPALFDPRAVPVLSVDAQGPHVPEDRLSAPGLRALFAAPPVWEPEVREEPPVFERPPRPAAVLVPVVLRPEPTVLLTLRTGHLASHAGQIAFPGGKIDASDPDAAAAALREAEEEVGLAPDFVEVLGHLPLYTTGTAFAITPVVGLVRPGFRLQPNPNEVAEAFEVPLRYLMNPGHHRRHETFWQGRMRGYYSMPFHDGVAERFIWGATAGMLRNLYRLLSA